jgi:hypothetical protein
MSDKETQSNTSKIKLVFLVCIIIWGILMIPNQLKSKYIGTRIFGIRGLISLIGLIFLVVVAIFLHFFRESSY